MKILMICTTSASVKGFRYGLIKKMQSLGHTIQVIAFDQIYKDDIERMGVEFYCIPQSNRSINPFKFFALKHYYIKIINKIKPDLVFTFMLKPNIIGTLSAKKVGVNRIFAMVEGLGDVFIYNSIKWRFIRWVVCRMYKKSMRSVDKIFFLNNDDKTEFINKRIATHSQCVHIYGIGVDLERFAYRTLRKYNTFLMVARMLRTKGVIEYCKAARIVKQKYPEAVFNYLGAEGDLKIADIQEFISDGSINYLGTTDDVRPFLEDCSVFILPSYYGEGLPMSIMEAEAVGRAIITTNNVGCRDTVIDGYNGFLVEKQNVEDLVKKIELLYNSNTITIYGLHSRKYAERYFDADLINQQIIDFIGA